MGGNQIGSSPMESTGRSRKRGKEEEGKVESKLEVTEIGIPSKEGLDKAEMYHVVKEIIGFILHMHQQIPSILQRLEDEFDNLRKERECLEETNLQPMNSKSSTQRMHKYRIREVKQRLRRLDKRRNSKNCEQNIRRKVKETLSRKVIRTLMSMGAGGVSYTGPAKLFLLVKAPGTLNLPLHFFPKRDFRYSKKVIPLRLHIKCKAPVRITNDSDHAHSTCDLSSSDLIWYQCRHTIKGLPSTIPLPE